jgi:adenylate cyclase
MDMKAADSLTYCSLDQTIVHLKYQVEKMQCDLSTLRSASIPKSVYVGVNQLAGNLVFLRNNIVRLEAERQNMAALAQIVQFINSSLELDDVLRIVMDTIVRLTHAERGFLMLRNDQGEFVIHMARNWEQESIEPNDDLVSRTVINRLVNTGIPVLTTDAQEDPRFTGKESIVAHHVHSILCVPLAVKGALTGLIYADSRIRSGIFTVRERDLLVGFAEHAAVAIENARLFSSVRRTLAEVNALKSLTDNVFASIASGVLTTDIHERVVMYNRAAEFILGGSAGKIIGCVLDDAVPQLACLIRPYIDRVLQTDESVLGLEISPNLPERGTVDLQLSLSPLKDDRQVTRGVAIVLDDLTEKKRLQAQRNLFARMVSPAVIEHLDPNKVQLGGQRAEITILFADLRGFTELSEMIEPERLVTVLNRYLSAAADAIMNEGGTVDKFAGDSVMAWFNAPVLQPDHTLRAVRASLAIRDVVARMHKGILPAYRLSFGLGIHVGEAVLGLIGTEKRLDYTAIGDSVNTAKRIQEAAAAGEISSAARPMSAWMERCALKSLIGLTRKESVSRLPFTVWKSCCRIEIGDRSAARFPMPD